MGVSGVEVRVGSERVGWGGVWQLVGGGGGGGRGVGRGWAGGL